MSDKEKVITAGEDTEFPNTRHAKFILMSDVTARKTEWLWYPYIALGKVTIMMGDPGEGKSTLALNLAAAVSRGWKFPSKEKTVQPEFVIYQNAEDGLEDTIRPRLDSAGADPEMVVCVNEEKEPTAIGDDRLERLIFMTKAKLVILDPLQAYLGADVDMHRANEIRPLMAHLASLAEENHCAIVLIGHMNKRGDMKSIYRGVGSIDLTAAARSVLLVGRDPSDPEHRVVMQVKNSLAREGAPVSFRVDETGVFTYEGEYDISIERLVNGGERRITARDRCAELLRGWLTEYGPLPTREVYDLACSEGINKRMLYRAANVLGVIMKKDSKGCGIWSLPDGGKPSV